MEYKSIAAAVRVADLKVTTGNSKMPGTTLAIDPFACKKGEALAQIPGSTCHKCYARKIARFRVNVGRAWAANQKAFEAAVGNPDALAAIGYQIQTHADKSGVHYHRWFDAGDLASVAMLDAIVGIARMTPDVNHWLPTREAAMVREYVTGHQLPGNLVIRVSAPRIDGRPVKTPAGVLTSTVHAAGQPDGHICPASKQGNQCGDCRVCWSQDVPNVSYPLH